MERSELLTEIPWFSLPIQLCCHVGDVKSLDLIVLTRTKSLDSVLALRKHDLEKCLGYIREGVCHMEVRMNYLGTVVILR